MQKKRKKEGIKFIIKLLLIGIFFVLPFFFSAKSQVYKTSMSYIMSSRYAYEGKQVELRGWVEFGASKTKVNCPVNEPCCNEYFDYKIRLRENPDAVKFILIKIPDKNTNNVCTKIIKNSRCEISCQPFSEEGYYTIISKVRRNSSNVYLEYVSHYKL